MLVCGKSTLPRTNMEVENGPGRKTIFHYKQVVFHFHVNCKESLPFVRPFQVDGRPLLGRPSSLAGQRRC